MRLSRSGVLLAGSAGRDIRFAAPPPPYSKVPSVSQTAAAPVPALDPVPLAQALIRCPSVTPEDKGALGVLEAVLAPLGFRCERLRFSAPGTPDVENLYARWGSGGRNFCFRSEEHTSELQSLMRISYAVFCLKKKTNTTQ